MSDVRTKLKLLAVAAVAAGTMLSGPLASTAHAQASDWPNKPVTLVVPWGPGASNDAFTRALAEIFTKRFGQPFVVDNRPGANGFVGSSSAARAEPDGYTFLENNVGIAALGLTDRGIQFDVTKDVTPVGALATSPSGIHVPYDSPIQSIQDLVAAAKAKPEGLFYGTTSVNGTQALQVELFNLLAGIKMKPVVYKSSADAQKDLVAGRIDVYFVTVSSTIGQIESKQVRLIGYTGKGVPSTAPQAPTVEEAGIPGYDSQHWWGFWAPNGTPRDIIEKFNAALNDALKEPTIVAMMARSGAVPAPGTPEDFAARIAREREEVADLIVKAGIQVSN